MHESTEESDYAEEREEQMWTEASIVQLMTCGQGSCDDLELSCDKQTYEASRFSADVVTAEDCSSSRRSRSSDLSDLSTYSAMSNNFLSVSPMKHGDIETPETLNIKQFFEEQSDSSQSSSKETRRATSSCSQ